MIDDGLDPRQIGRVLKEMRKHGGLTLDEVGKRSGVSKSMLSQIEAGKTNPTLAMLWKISRGMSRSIQDILSGSIGPRQQTEGFSEWVNESSGPTSLVSLSAEQYTRLEADKPGVHFSVLTPLEQVEDLEVYLIRLEAGSELDSLGHPPGTQEFLTLLEGRIEVRAGDDSAVLDQKGFFMYPADARHSIRNLGTSAARIHLTVRFRHQRRVDHNLA